MFTACNISGDIMVVIDESGSIEKENFYKIIDAVMFFIKSLDIQNGNVRIGIITYAQDVFVHYDLDAYDNKLDMLFVCNLLRYKYKGGSTLTHKALKYLKYYSFTYHKGDRPEYRNYVLFFTDGKSRYPRQTIKHARALKRTGAKIYTIGIGRNINKRELFRIASKPKRKHRILTSFIRLKLEMNRVMTQVCKGMY